jgi:two-component system sensor histidine kinase/response regulator
MGAAMPTVLIQADVYSLLGVVLGLLALGAALAWLLLRRRDKGSAPAEANEKEGLYLVFSRLSHRLKTAGEVTRGHLHGFGDELPKDAERWRVARRSIAEEASGIDSLVNRLDLVVRLGMAGQPLVMEPVNVPRLLEDIMVGLGPAADARGIVLGGVVSSSGKNVPHISADKMALREVFSNLLENAVKHNGPGAEVTAEVKQQDGRLLVRIADNGKGIPQELLSALFEKGNHSYRPAAARGTGMGLYLCKLLVELHGGEITAIKRNQHGTEFHILLPVRRAK